MITINVIGACHPDITLQLEIETAVGRTNPANTCILPGGVAANIARALWASDVNLRIEFVGAASENDDRAEKWLQSSGIVSEFLRVDAAPPTYTAILDQHGELLIGSADMGLYGRVLADNLIPMLPEQPRTVIIDANFPAEVLLAVAQSLPDRTKLFAAGTSIEKVDRLFPLMTRLDALSLNRAEAGKLTGADNGVAALAGSLLTKLHRPDARILVSDGADLAALACGGKVVVSHPPKIELTNANGAGDAMAAAFFQACLDTPEAKDDTPAVRRELADMLDLALAAGAAHAAAKRNVWECRNYHSVTR
jgi:sugar/nucleoside kinase (ribokinase family)